MTDASARRSDEEDGRTQDYADQAPVRQAVADYKRLLQTVLENRPSGTRQRLASVLGTNRSFVSQIANPAYSMPIPAQHLETIFDLCHFAQGERMAFLAAYERAHPSRRRRAKAEARMRVIAVTVPDRKDVRKNQAIDRAVAEFARQIAGLADDLSS